MDFSQKLISPLVPSFNFQQFSNLSKYFLQLVRWHFAFRSQPYAGKGLFSAILLLMINPTASQTHLMPASARIIGLAGGQTCLSGDGIGCAHPAGLCAEPHWAAEITYHRPYGLAELANQQATLRLSQPHYGLALGVQLMGFALYQEGQICFAGGRTVWRQAIVGATLRQGWIKIRNYGQTGFHTADLSFLYPCGSTFSYGGLVTNILSSRFGPSRTRLPLSWQTGICYRPTPAAAVYLDYYKATPWPGCLRLAAEISHQDLLRLRLGWCTEPATLAFGLGVQQGNLIFDYGCGDHPDLGFSHMVTCSFLRAIK